MRILHEVCSLPTAPFAEGRVVRYVEQFVREHRWLKLSRDEDGNLLITLPGKKKGLPRWVFGAHMDHPGMIARRMLDARTVEADFRGSVHADFVKGTKVVFFDGDHEVRGRVVAVQPDDAGLRIAGAGGYRWRSSGRFHRHVRSGRGAGSQRHLLRPRVR